ncbi:uncharacterized protein LOC133337555 [Musca vetustissima]|uniref:uncharacterized protein LOC133337555 n=1 Tax=Musca vetustissima TaxID=27455 RepID=UPI002AB7D23E|nr:uncharacterized protein LOC133337555 [Musca vetustissima]
MAPVACLARFTNIQCLSLDKEFTTVAQCSLKMIKRNVVALNIHCRLHKVPVDKVTVNVALYKRSNGFQPFLINATGDLCKFFANRKKNQIFMILAQYFLRNSNVNHSCPYDHDIIVHNLILDNTLFSSLPLQNGDYMFKVLAGIMNVWKVEFKVHFRKS